MASAMAIDMTQLTTRADIVAELERVRLLEAKLDAEIQEELRPSKAQLAALAALGVRSEKGPGATDTASRNEVESAERGVGALAERLQPDQRIAQRMADQLQKLHRAQTRAQRVLEHVTNILDSRGCVAGIRQALGAAAAQIEGGTGTDDIASSAAAPDLDAATDFVRRFQRVRPLLSSTDADVQTMTSAERVLAALIESQLKAAEGGLVFEAATEVNAETGGDADTDSGAIDTEAATRCTRLLGTLHGHARAFARSLPSPP